MNDCVNPNTKVCVFGHGGITVNIIGSTLVLTEINPRMEPGTQLFKEDCTMIGEWEYIGIPIHIHLHNMSEVETLLRLLKDIEDNQGGSFEFEGVTFDFTKYHAESIRIVRAAVEFAKKWIISLMAC